MERQSLTQMCNWLPVLGSGQAVATAKAAGRFLNRQEKVAAFAG